MKTECRNFRARLADALRGPLRESSTSGHDPAHGGSLGLGWHAHVIHCGACRELLSEEAALDELLRSLPKPHLPRALAERVLSRLDAARRGLDLDHLLDLERAEPAPANLARGVIARVHAETQLDRLLERVPAVQVPVGLDRRVLARLELARRSAKPRTQRATPIRKISSKADTRQDPRRLALRIAAGFALVSLAAWGAWSLRRALLEEPSISHDLVLDPPPNTLTPQVAVIPPTEPATIVEMPTTPAAIQPNDELLASLEMFEAWDLLSTSDGVDASLSTLDSLDEYLLDFDSASSTGVGASVPATPGADSDSKSTKKNG